MANRKLEIIIYCHNFQQRLCWTLASIMQQNPHPFDVTVNIATLQHNGIPSTEYIVNYYLSYSELNVKHHAYESKYKDIFARCSLVKNHQIAENDADLFMFHSADHMLHPDHLNQVAKAIDEKGSDICLCQYCRVTTDLDETNDMMNLNAIMPSNAYDRIFKLKRSGYRNKKRPGGHIVVSKKAIIEKSNGYYIDPGKCRDFHLFEKGQCSRSDLIFRRKIGKTMLIKTSPMIHLEHTRDKELGYHTEEQR